MIQAQVFVASMCEAIPKMKLTERQREMVKAAFRAAIDYANAKHGMHASKEAKLAVSPTHGDGK